MGATKVTCDFTIGLPGSRQGEHCSVPEADSTCCALMQTIQKCGASSDMRGCINEAGANYDIKNPRVQCEVLTAAQHNPELCSATILDALALLETSKVTCDFTIGLPGSRQGEHCSVPEADRTCCAFMQTIQKCGARADMRGRINEASANYDIKNPRIQCEVLTAAQHSPELCSATILDALALTEKFETIQA